MILQNVSDLNTKVEKIISLVPSQTELLFDLGLNEQVIGITKFCIHPNKWFTTKTRIGGTKNVNMEAVKALQPHLIIANKEENVKEQIEELAKEFNVWVTDVNTFDDAMQIIEDIGHLTSTTTKANHLTQKIKTAFKNIKQLEKPINTCYLIWQNPYMTIGGDTFIHDMLQKCSFNNIFANQSRYPEISINQLQTANCQLLLLSSEPYPFKQKHIDELQQQLPNTKILLVDGEMFSWYGSRLLHAPKYFNEMIIDLQPFLH
jgi:ABC-type Fe3+-hydroxamate transport system substrate-binding protein